MDTYHQDVWFQFFIYLSRHIDKQISDTGRHSAQVAQWVKETARSLDFAENKIQALFWAALLHDIGKIGIPEEILQKPGPLSEEEWDMIRLHPTIGANIVRSLKQIAHIAPEIHAHQEKYDGSGYPNGLQGEDIPLGARVLAVADAYTAMTEERVYSSARSHTEAEVELKSLKGKQFDPVVVDVFLDIVNESLTI
jgi:putative nucleotidyltransferase with HDIG domain